MLDQLKIKNCVHERESTLPNHCFQIAAVIYVMRSLGHFPFMLVIVSLAMMRVQSISSIFKNSHNWKMYLGEQVVLLGPPVPGLSRLCCWEIWHLLRVHNFRINVCLRLSNVDSGLRKRQWLLLKTCHILTDLDCITSPSLHPWH